MEEDNRTKYVWVSAIIVLVGLTILSIETFKIWLIKPPLMRILFWSVFVTFIPIWISGLKNPLRNYLGYGIPAILLLPLSYFIYDFFTCTGKFCDIMPGLLGLLSVLSIFLFAVIYTLGLYARKRDVNFIKIVIAIELIFIIIVRIYIEEIASFIYY